jgi:hypothetical protein
VHLPKYLGDWIAGVLLESHSLPALVEHQDRLAEATMKSLEGAQGVPADPSTVILNPIEHLRRAQELVRLGEQKLLVDPAGYSSVGPAQLAQAHIAVAQEIDRQANLADEVRRDLRGETDEGAASYCARILGQIRDT